MVSAKTDEPGQVDIGILKYTDTGGEKRKCMLEPVK
jgi:hypothetical protein